MTGQCEGCGGLVDADELEPDHNGDPACGDCRTTWVGLDDGTEWRSWAYA